MVSPAVPYFALEEEPTRGYGSLEVYRGGQLVMLPLARVEIEAYVSDLITDVTVRQTFRNPHLDALEAVYIFPLAAGAAVSNFTLKVGGRTINGVVQERQQARQNYQQAIADGKQAALLEQERDDVFTVQVGNLPPGEEVAVEIQYSERLPFFEDGKTELRLPMVVSPRYTPGGALYRPQSGLGVQADTNRVADASRISPPRLAPFVDPMIDLHICVHIVGHPNEQEPAGLTCSQHAVRAYVTGHNQTTITLANARERLNRDFVLRWQTSGQQIRSSLLTYVAPDGQTYGMLSIIPPFQGNLSTPRDVQFVLDRSGSMGGVKMVSAVRACALLLNTLGPRDRFAIQAFDNAIEWMPGDYRDPYFIPADFYGQQKGENYLRTITARGGTELDKALANALSAVNRQALYSGRTATVVLLTDGEVSNEAEILRRIQHQIGNTRLFSVGIDTAVNGGLLKRLASLGRGTCTLVEPGNQLEDALAGISREIGQPLVTHLGLQDRGAGIQYESMAPSKMGDLFAGRASVTFFRSSSAGAVHVIGQRTDGGRFEVSLGARQVNLPAIAQLWAKARVVDLEDEYRIENTHRKEQIKREIVSLAVRHSLLTKFTAFLVVDHSRVVNPTGMQVRQVQPAETPASWDALASLNLGQIGAFFGQSLGLSKSRGAAAYSFDDCAEDTSVGYGAPPAQQSCWGAPAPAPSSPSPSASQDAWGAPIGGIGNCWGGSSFDGETCERTAGAHAESGAAPGGTSRPASAAMIPSSYQHDGGTIRPGNCPIDRNHVLSALDAFLKGFDQAFTMIELMTGKPLAAVLEQLRQRLLQMLAPIDLGLELPLIQRFLRANAIELIASLSSTGQVSSSLRSTWMAHRQTFHAARLEAEGVLHNSTRAVQPGATGAFWEDSI